MSILELDCLPFFRFSEATDQLSMFRFLNLQQATAMLSDSSGSFNVLVVKSTESPPELTGPFQIKLPKTPEDVGGLGRPST